MKHYAILIAIGALVSACGGGSNNDGSPVAQVPANKLAAYAGTWSTDCYNNHDIATATISSPSANTVTIHVQTDYYAGANCTGAIVATETESADVTATYVDTVDSSIVLTQGAAATPAKVDRVTTSLPQRTRSITGTGVKRVVVDGQAQWCINYGDGSQTCLRDDGTYPAQNGISRGVFLQNNALYELSPSGSVYVLDDRLTKK